MLFTSLTGRIKGKREKLWSQTKPFIICPKQVFFFFKKKKYLNFVLKGIKRKIPANKISAATISKMGSEFVFHVPDEYDYRYSSFDKSLFSLVFNNKSIKIGVILFWKVLSELL